MSSINEMLMDIARLHDETANRLRAYVAEANRQQAEGASVETRVLDQARKLHPSLGARQEEALTLIARSFPDGVGTGFLTKAMKYDQPNVYLTLQALIKQKLVRKDGAAKPHKYHLAEELAKSAAGTDV